MTEFHLVELISSLGPSGLLAAACYFLWKAYQTEINYNKEQDRENLKTINGITRVLDRIMDIIKDGNTSTQEQLKDTKQEVKSIHELLNSRSNEILKHLNKNGNLHEETQSGRR